LPKWERPLSSGRKCGGLAASSATAKWRRDATTRPRLRSGRSHYRACEALAQFRTNPTIRVWCSQGCNISQIVPQSGSFICDSSNVLDPADGPPRELPSVRDPSRTSLETAAAQRRLPRNGRALHGIRSSGCTHQSANGLIYAHGKTLASRRRRRPFPSPVLQMSIASYTEAGSYGR
jgi:hypothetical protein